MVKLIVAIEVYCWDVGNCEGQNLDILVWSSSAHLSSGDISEYSGHNRDHKAGHTKNDGDNDLGGNRHFETAHEIDKELLEGGNLCCVRSRKVLIMLQMTWRE